MSSIPEQIAVAAQTRLEIQLAVINALSNLAFGGIEKIIALNFNAVKKTLESSTAATQQLMSAQGPQDFLSLSTERNGPRLEEILSYSRELASISGNAREEFLQAVSTLGAFDLVGPNAVSVPVTTAAAPKVKIALKATTEGKTKSTVTTATAAIIPVTAKPSAKPVAKVPANDNTQLSLLSASDKKAAPVARTAAKKATTKATVKAIQPAEVKQIEVKSTKAKPAPTAVEAATKKPVIESAPKQDLPISKVEAKPEVEAVPEKKTAVKFPFPVTPKKPGAKPSFPASPARPSYKAKGSAATGAKKPVRQ
jgi:phasin family protein